MAFKLGKPRGRYRPLSEINVTPLVDVMLVLLIIFMVTAPLMTTSVNIDLPKVVATPINQDTEPLRVQVDSQGSVYLQDTPIELPDLVSKLQAISQNQNDRRIFVRGDKANSYGRMLQVMATIIQGGFTKVSLLTDPSVPITVPQPEGGTSAAPAAPAAAPASAAPAVITPSGTKPATPGPRQPGRG
jgi:biopolymer transport protein TolR